MPAANPYEARIAKMRSKLPGMAAKGRGGRAASPKEKQLALRMAKGRQKLAGALKDIPPDALANLQGQITGSPEFGQIMDRIGGAFPRSRPWLDRVRSGNA